MPRMVLHPAGLLYQVSHTTPRPQARGVPQGFRPPFQSRLDRLHIPPAQPRLASRSPRLLQPRPSQLRHLSRPSIHRLPVHPYSPRHLRLRKPSLQQLRCLHPPSLYSFKISPYSYWISHTDYYTRSYLQCHYILRASIGAPQGGTHDSEHEARRDTDLAPSGVGWRPVRTQHRRSTRKQTAGSPTLNSLVFERRRVVRVFVSDHQTKKLAVESMKVRCVRNHSLPAPR